MVEQRIVKAIDEQIKETEQSLTEFPEPVRTRMISLKIGPREVISRINQIDGLIIEIEER